MTKKRNKKSKSLSLEYQVNIAFDLRDGIYVARVPELENCHTDGKSPEEALANAREAIELWLETARRRKIAIPEPISRKKGSGRFVLRTPSDVHTKLAEEALRRGKSMNELAVEFISDGLKKVG